MDLLHDDKRRLNYSAVNMKKIIIGLWLLMFAWLFFVALPAANAQMGIGNTFYINGVITFEHEKQFRANRDKIKYLVLNSKGGGMQFAYNIMIMVNHLDITVLVPKDATCQSACTVIYQAAKRRLADESATFVYHAIRFDGKFMTDWIRQCPRPNAGCKLVFDQMQRDLVKETHKMFRALEKHGMSMEVLRQLSMRPLTRDPNWIQQGNLLRIADLEYTATEAMRYNIVTQIIQTSE